MQITEKQKQQLIDLNDSRVNEILNLGLKVGEWYKDLNEKGLYYITEIKEDRFYFLGFDVNGDWKINDWYLTNKCVLSKATKQEVKQALANEAKRRGFKKGVQFKCLIRSKVGVLTEDYFLYNGSFGRGNSLESSFEYTIINGVLFKDGVWAEIIDDKAELKQEIKELRNKLKSLEEKL